ncbi:MAG TPA: universal stress protein [Elusimicrobiota bacterium]|nr:universal stress protein [Elusimicrobiota bacterium]
MSAEEGFAPPKKILVASDFRAASAAAARYARVWADLFGASLTLVHSQHFEFPPYFTQAQMKAILRETARAQRRAESHAAAWLRRAGGGQATVLVSEKPPVEAVVRAARDEKADLTFMGTHGRTGAGRLWMGSVAEGVVRAAEGPVMIVRPQAPVQPPRLVLCAIGEDGAGLRALAYAAGLARAAGAKLLSARLGKPARGGAKAAGLGAFPERIESIPVKGEPAQGVLKLWGERQADLIVMETERRPSFLRSVFGTAAEKVMHGASVPFLAVPEFLPERAKEGRSDG